jgi:hypothetical protein
MRVVRPAALAGTWLIVSAAATAAQAPALLWWTAPSHNPGFSAHADYALADGELGKQRAGALTLGYARDRVRMAATLGRAGSREDLHEGSTVLGAAGSWRFLSSTRSGVSADVQAGVGGGSFDLASGERYSQVNVPVGIGVAILARPPIGNVELSAGGRAQLRRTSLETAPELDDTDVGLGLSLGLEWTSLRRVGVHLGVDWLRIRSVFADEGRSEWTFGFGAHYRFRPTSWIP